MFRTEIDGLGEKQLPEEALYGIHSLRAKENFPISGRRLDEEFIRSIVQVKKAAAAVNGSIGSLTGKQAEAILHACDELLAGKHTDAFVVDAMQGGAGTSANMNANEVIANLAVSFLGGKYGDYSLIHPIDHVNMYQSTNDVIPTAGRIAVYRKCARLLERLGELREALAQKASEFEHVLKVGRTQLQDAVPMSFGQGFHAYASMISRSMEQLAHAAEAMRSVNLGATAIGTAINVPGAYFDRIIGQVSAECGIELTRCGDLFDGTQNADDFAAVSSAVKVCAIKLSKLASDLRLLSSGPESGFGELHLPAKQSGSSIMPGKINPVLPEALNQAAFLVVGHDLTVTQAVEAGQLELNAFLPVILFQLFEEIDILGSAVATFTENCVKGITVNEKTCREDIARCFSIATALNPAIGYDKSTEIVKKSRQTGRSVAEIARSESGLSEEELSSLLDPYILANKQE